jgi:hypothetical protein
MAEAKSPQLICLIASHVNSLKRIERVLTLFSSIKKQSQMPTRTIMSMSSSLDKENSTAIQSVLEAAKEASVEVIQQAHALKQFEHYDFLTNLLKDYSDNTWILFSDDDDIWHEDRIASYQQAISTVDEKCMTVKSLVCKRNDKIMKLAIDVLNCYVNYATRLSRLRLFMSGTSLQVKRHASCDLLFARFMALRVPITGFTTKEGNWMYDWTNDQSYQHNTQLADMKFDDTLTFDEGYKVMINELDYFMARSDKQDVDCWLSHMMRYYKRIYGTNMNEIILAFMRSIYDTHAKESIFLNAKHTWYSRHIA